MISRKTIFIALGFLFFAGMVYYSGLYLDKKAQLRLDKLAERKRNQVVAKPPPPKVEKTRGAWLIPDAPNSREAVLSRVRFPSVRGVRAGLVADISSGEVLWAKNARKSVPIASLSKVMTALVILDKIKADPTLSLQTRIDISASAKKTASSVFLRKYPLKSVSIEELLMSALVKSANDSCQLLAEYFGQGKASSFALLMNQKAEELGLRYTHFSNAHGLPFDRQNPALDNHSSMRDMLIVSGELIKHPQVLKWTSNKSLSLPRGSKNPVRIGSTNPFLDVRGVNGLKTGFTNNAGWCQILTCRRDGHFYVIMVSGCASKGTRNASIRELLNWAFKRK